MNHALALLGGLLFMCAPAPEAAPSRDVAYSTHTEWLGMVRFHVLLFDPGQVEMRLLVPEEGVTLQRVARMPGCDEALACFNASFFLASGRPMGLMVSQSRKIQGLRKVSWGVFWVDKEHKPHVSRKRHFQKKVKMADVAFAVQSGPTILLDGKIIPKDSRPASRTAVGIDGKGRVVVVATKALVTLDHLSRFAAKNLGVVDLVNLDGGTSTQLMLDGEKGATLYGVPVAVGIGLYGRSH
jgi:uncharacterized protein YigE (DUF2233 family)